LKNSLKINAKTLSHNYWKRTKRHNHFAAKNIYVVTNINPFDSCHELWAVVTATTVYGHYEYTSFGTKFHASYKTKGQFI